MKLQFKYEFVPHPYPDETSSIKEAWAKMKLQIVNNRNQVEKVVFDIQWDMKKFINWIALNKPFIFEENPPQQISHYASIAKGLYEFFDNLDPEKEEETTLLKLYNYRTRHGLRFALRGVDVDDVYIGLINGNLTISFCESVNEWDYKSEVKDFLNEIDKLIGLH